MNQSTTPIEVITFEAVHERVSNGLMAPLNEGPGLQVVDCGDDRSLTVDYYQQRSQRFDHEVSPGRYFGAASGLAIASLITFAAEHGDRAVKQFVHDYTPEGFVDYASDLSDRAHHLAVGIDLNQHSSDQKEGNPTELADHKQCENPLDCKFATALGAVLFGANSEWVVDEASRVLSITGSNLPLQEAAEGIAVMQRHVPEDFGIHRGALHFVQTRTSRYTPIAIHEGVHAPNHEAALVIDLAGYRSNANAHNQRGLYRYQHTPQITTEVLPRLMPELKLDPRLLQAASLLLGHSTRLALSGQQTPDALRLEVIPADYTAAA